MGYGDELCVTGHVRVLQQTDPRKVRLEYERRTHWSEVFDHNPRIAREGDVDVQVFRPRANGLRPYCSEKRPDRWIWRDYKPPVGELYFQPDELAFAARCATDIVVIEPTVKSNASPNKQWGERRWEELVRLMRLEGLQAVQLGRPGTSMVKGAGIIDTITFRQACAVLTRARAAVVHEGGLHHGAAAVGLKSVVIYGGFISPRQTGYDLHTNVFTGGEPCGWRTRCNHCAVAMARIDPAIVMDELRRLLSHDAARAEASVGAS